MFPLLDRNIPHVEQKILSYLGPKELATSMLVCMEWYQKARPFLYEWYATIQRENEKVPLQMAIISGYDHLVSFFLRDKQVNINESCKWTGWTALMEATFLGEESITRMLLEREDIDVNMKTEYGNTALSLAAADGHTGVVKILLERTGILVNSALIAAAKVRHASVVEELLKHPDIDVNFQDLNGHTVVSHAKNHMTMDYIRERTLNKEKIIKMLEERNAM